MIEDLPPWARSTPRQAKDLLLEALDARDLDEAGRAEAVLDIGERFDLLFEQPIPTTPTGGSSSTSATSATPSSPSSPPTVSMPRTGEENRA